MTSPITVLHVDDDSQFAEMAARFLERENDRFDVLTATDADEGLETLCERTVDCVVSDHDMPGRNGIEFLEDLREEYPELPFILYTGKGSEEIASRAVSAGVTDYLQKEPGTEQYTLLANRIENAVERFRSRRDARTHRRRLETLVDNLPGIVYRCRNDPGWPMEYVAGDCEEITGYTPERLESESLAWGEDVIHPDDREAVWTEIQDALAADESFELTYRIRTAAGERRWVTERGCAVGSGGSDGSDAPRLEGVITDVTESRRRERRFEAIFDNTYQFTGLLEPDGTVIEANETALEFAGVDRGSVVGDPLWETPWFERSEGGPALAREAVETAREGELYRNRATVHGGDGDALIDFSVRPVRDETGEVTLLIPEGRDITEFVEQKRRSRRNERRFEAIFDDPNLLVGLLDVDETLREVNRTALGYVDADREAVIGEPFPETPWWGDDRREDVERWIQRAADGDYVDYTVEHDTGEGKPSVVEGTFRPVTDESDAVTAIVVSGSDVTERARRERELKRQNERLDEFASFVSHDLKNPISTVRGRLHLALETDEMEHVDQAVDAIERVDDLRVDLASTLRTGEIVDERTAVRVSEAAEGVRSVVDPPNAVSITVADDPVVDADPDAFQRLLENLVGNSIEHGGSDVDVRIGALEEGLYYEDDGPGIDPDHRERVFTPGFSTKESGEGIGMGMASVRQIVLAHGWEISIADAEELSGVRFEIRTGGGS
jgi:PAS domain S-box-containing protein